MNRKSLALVVAILALIGAALVFLRTSPKSASEGTSARPALQPSPAPDPTGALAARRLSPVGWNPPAVFAEKGAPAPLKVFPRGENASRQYPHPATLDLPHKLRSRTPAVLAKTPADGRLHLLPEEIDLHTRIARRMVFDPAAVDRVIAGKTSRILAPTTGNEVLTLEFHAVKTRSQDSHTLLGRVVGEEETSDALIVYHDGVIHGEIARYDTDQHLEYRILADGHMMVRELDPSTMTTDCGNGPETACDNLHEENADGGGDIIPQGDGEAAGDTAGWRTVDVVVGYDPGARVADGGYAQIEARIIASVDRMTTAFSNSLVADAEVMLLGTIEDPDYVFPGSDSGSQSGELGNLNNFTNGALDVVSNYYTLLGADLLTFVQKQADGSAGLAYLPGRASIVARDYMTSSRITFAHELGHSLGCDHSWGDSSQNYHARYGWRLETPTGTRVRTIMAYDWAWGSGTRIPYYSNPSVSYNGAATGAVNGYNVLGDLTGDQRYYQGGLGYSGSDASKYGFNGANAALGANNANTISTGAGNSSYGVTFASNRATRASFAVTSPVAGVELSRGASQNIFFRGGDMDDLAAIQLFKAGVFHSTLASNLNPATGRSYSWAVSASLLAGQDYMIRVVLNHPGGGTSTSDSGVFTILGYSPRISSQSPAASLSVSGPVSQVSLTFSQVMDPASFSIGDDILSFTGPQGLTLAATGATWSNGNTVLNIQFPAQSQSGFYRVVVAPDIANLDGYLIDQNQNDIAGEFPGDRYVASFQISGVGTPVTLWSDMVGTDAPDAGWSFSGTNSSWQAGAPTSSPGTAYDGGDIIGQNLAGDYNALENSHAQSPIINCGSHTNITLAFSGWKGAGKNDTLTIEAWNGSSWQQVYAYTGPANGASETSWTLYQPALGTHGNLNPNFRLRWGLVDVTNGNSGTQTGWQLDSIIVQGTSDASAPAAWITSHFPQGMVEDSHSSMWLEFSQPMDTGSFALNDITSFTGPSGSITATGFQWLDSTLLRVDFPAQHLLGQYALALAPTVLDETGQPLDQDFDGTPGETIDDSYAATFQIGSSAGLVDHFEITGIPASVTYGTAINDITITARDAAGKIAASFTGTVTFGGTAGITGTSASFSDGVLSNVSITPPVIGSGLTFTVDDGLAHTGSAVLAVTPITATIGFVSGSLNQTYDGLPRTVTATTDPPGLAYTISYEGDPAAPVNAGGYDVSATITAPNYQGSVSDTLIVAKAAQTINFGPLATVGNDQAPFVLTATATSGLAVSYTSSNPAVATVSGNTVTVIADGSTTITASQAGNINYLPAANVLRELVVLRVQPIAKSGGPYKLLIGQTLFLDGSASLPSDGATIAAYGWDMNNDNYFADATGATPPGISYATLTGTWGMMPGMNTISLKVTDSVGKTATVSTTVELVASLTWDNNGTGAGQTNGGGAWLGSSLWWDGSANLNWISGSNAIFGGPNTAGGAITLASPTTVNAITFNAFTGTFTLGTTGQTITLHGGINKTASSATAVIASPVSLAGDQTWTNNSSGFLTASGVIGGSGGITKSGSGTLLLNSAQDANNYTGNTKVTEGILQLGNSYSNANNIPGGLGGSSGTGASNLDINGGTVTIWYYMTRTLGAGPGQIQITGGRSGLSNKQSDAVSRNWRIGDNAANEIVWGGDHFKPTTLVLQDAAASPGSATFTLDNKINLNAATRTIEVGASTATLSQIIRNSSGTAGLIKTGNGILILSASNTYNGTTIVSSGMLDFAAGNLGFGGGTGRNISVAEGTAVRRNALDNTFLKRLVETTDEITVMTATTANNLDFSSSTGANLPNAYLGNWASNGAKMEYSGTLTPASDAYRLGGKGSSGLLGIVGTNKLTAARGLIVGGTGASGIRVMLAGSNDFSGDTVINTGAKLTIGNNLALQNSALEIGASGGNFALNSAGTVTGASSSPSPTFGGLKGSRNLLSAFTNTGGNNESNLVATDVTGFTLNPGTGKSFTYSGAIADFAAGTTLTKTGPGTQILAGANTYTGATNINQGKLFINGSLSNANAALDVNSGATLGGTGTIGRNANIQPGGKLEFNLSTNAANHDRLDISSGRNFTFSGTSELTITTSGGATQGVYTLITGGNNISGAVPSTVNLPVGWIASVSISGNSLLLNLTSTVGDITPPALVGMTDDKSGGAVPENTPVIYTVTFSEDMDAATVTAADFGNAGTSTVAIGAVSEISPGVFTVETTPSTSGTLQLKVNQSAVLKDSASNNLDTTSAIPDDTVITILTPYGNWADGTFANAFTATEPEDDQDNDGKLNLLEYAFGTDPTVSSSNPITHAGGAVTAHGQPVLVQEGGSYYAVFGRRVDHAAAGLTYAVRFSADLEPTFWLTSTEEPTVVATDGTIEAVRIPYPGPIPTSGGPKDARFFNVSVSGN